MDNNYDRLKRLFDQLKSIGLWDRIFKWKSIKNLMIDASGDFSKLQVNSEILVGENIGLKSKAEIADAVLETKQTRVTDLESDLRLLSEKHDALVRKHTELSENAGTNLQSISELSERKNELERELAEIKKDYKQSQEDLTNANTKVVQFESTEESRTLIHSKNAATLKDIHDGIKDARQKELDAKIESERLRVENLKLTWSNHEIEVKQYIKSLCSKHTIQYVDKVPFKGEPDNTLHIAGEYIIFDAKSPRGEDLANFQAYIKDQTEKVRKYVKEENVKKWIFFVVPSNTFEVIKTFVYSLGDYDVFVINHDALEPIILSLRKIEEYDFADQMNPEDRENICRVLGRFAHLSKRRIQIDTYFINQFMELAYKSESDLPPDVLEKVIEFEKAEKLNPPQEKRAKAINLQELQKSTEKLRIDTESKGILIEDAKITLGLNDLPLYK